MKILFAKGRVWFAIGCVVIAAAGWARGASQADDAATRAVPAAVGRPAALPRRHRCTDLRGSSQVIRVRNTNGGETLRGDTDLPLAPGSTGRLHLSESATVDARGLLVAARLVAARPRAPLTTYLLQPLAAKVRILREGTAPVDWPVPADAPWIYRASSSAEGLLASTPIAAWVAARASATAAGAVVRVLVPERQVSYLAPIDQIAVATEKGTTVVLDADGIDVGEEFVTEARLTERKLTLVCADATTDGGRGESSARAPTVCPRRGDVSRRGPPLSAAPAGPARRAFP